MVSKGQRDVEAYLSRVAAAPAGHDGDVLPALASEEVGSGGLVGVLAPMALERRSRIDRLRWRCGGGGGAG